MVIFRFDPEEVEEYEPELSAYYSAQSTLFNSVVYKRRLGRARRMTPADMVFGLLENTVRWSLNQVVRFAGFTVAFVMTALPKVWQKITRARIKRALQQPSNALGEAMVGLGVALQKAGRNLLKSKKSR